LPLVLTLALTHLTLLPWLALAVTTPSHFTIRVENRREGRVEVITEGKTLEVGRVIIPLTEVNPNGFTASRWGRPGAVVATAVNAIHILVRTDPESGKGVVFSLLSQNYLSVSEQTYQSYLNKSASIITTIEGGKSIFGGAYAPLVGSRVKLSRAGKVGELPSDYRPQPGDVILIEVERPAPLIASLEFENRFGGLITLCPPHRLTRWFEQGQRGVSPPEEALALIRRLISLLPPGSEWLAERRCFLVGEVLRPVVGVGRFLGTQYAGVGRIRANHPGVIDISTSPYGKIGGFQIIPADHAMSPEMWTARELTQWMVVGPPHPLAGDLKGKPPLFFGFLYPSYPAVEESPDALAYFLSRFRVEAKIDGSWRRLPEVVGRDDRALRGVEAIRILFPLEVSGWAKLDRGENQS